METFYATLSGICFTLLGLWWVVVQMKYELWMSTPARRRVAYAASMHFIAPGLIALVAIIGAETQIWRLGAAIGGGLGAIVSGYAAATATLSAWQRVQEALICGLFIAITGLAFVTTPILGLSPIAVEALVDTGVLVLGVHFVWHCFSEAAPGT